MFLQRKRLRAEFRFERWFLFTTIEMAAVVERLKTVEPRAFRLILS
jgi:hypothetical protein